MPNDGVEILGNYYSNSRALIIGIDEYSNHGNLQYAVNDAEKIEEILRTSFGFQEENITLLLDEDANKNQILSSYRQFTDSRIDEDERIIFFFAGHGHTVEGRRDEVGYLVPSDGSQNSVDSLIRWDTLTRDASLIDAKHMFFIMDCCYGGHALNRNISEGSPRFLKDMLDRYTRQVVTAGKSDETVSDSGGPLSNHSVFTGHLIQGLQGRAAVDGQTITANSLMSYVYEKVSQDNSAAQTPHHGHIDGEGDLVFQAPPLNSSAGEDESSDEEGTEVLLTMSGESGEGGDETADDIIKEVKELLSKSGKQIELHDIVAQKTREVIRLTQSDYFDVNESFTLDEFKVRLEYYEEFTEELRQISATIGYWGEALHSDILTMIPARLTENFDESSGNQKWLKFRWYPVLLILYSSGIAAIASSRYGNLEALLLTEVASPDLGRERIQLAYAANKVMGQLNRWDLFGELSGYEKKYTPRSEYLYGFLESELDELFFLGEDYEKYFDEFEVWNALVGGRFYRSEENRFWAHPGRFAWKARKARDSNPLNQITEKVEEKGREYPPMNSELFPDGVDQFQNLHDELAELVSSLRWY